MLHVRALVIGGACIALPFALAAQVGTVGVANVSGQSWFQYWTTVSSDPVLYTRTGSFTIRTISRGRDDPPWDDGDWRIWSLPHSGSTELLYNNRGYRNYNNEVELELRTNFPLANYFNPGDQIIAKGWHVEDWGHSVTFPTPDVPAGSEKGGKTELHPVISVQSPLILSGDFKLFTAQDQSERFTPSEWNNTSLWTIPLAASPATRDLAQNPSGTHRFETKLLEESAIVDIGIASMGGGHRSAWATDHSVVEARQYPGELQLYVRLNPAGGYIEPLYFGDFKRSTEQLLHHEYITTLRTTNTRDQFLATRVIAKLLPSATHGRLPHSTWEYVETSSAGLDARRRIDNPQGDSLVLDLMYSPALGANTYEWDFAVMAGTRAPTWAPGAQRTVNGLAPAEQRVFAQSRVRHSIQPSSIALSSPQDINRTFTPPRQPGIALTASNSIVCVVGYSIDATMTLVHPQATPSGPRWFVEQTRQADGQQITNPTPIRIPNGGTPLDIGFVKLSVDAANPLKLKIDFEDANARTGGVGAPRTFLHSNSARLRVAVEYSTGLGERPRDTSDELFIRPCASQNLSLAQTWENFETLVIAMEKLHQMGLFSGRSLPSPLPQRFRTEWQRQQYAPIGEPDALLSRLPAAGQRIARTYLALQAGDTVGAVELRELSNALQSASQLPKLTRTKLPGIVPKTVQPPIGPDDALLGRSRGVLLNARVGSAPRGQGFDAAGLRFDGSGALDRESIQQLIQWAPAVRSARRPVEIRVITGPGLSQTQARARADAIRSVLLQEGLDPSIVSASGAASARTGQPGRVEIVVR